jgi:hypothetical protein
MQPVVYLRTHNGDPGPTGCFGIFNCMRSRRLSMIDADVVIGIGGRGKGVTKKIAGNVNWIGIGPRPHDVPVMKHPVLTFTHFLDVSNKNYDLNDYKALKARMYRKTRPGGTVRLVKNFSPEELRDIERLMKLAKNAPPSSENIVRLRSQMMTEGQEWPGADFGPKCGKRSTRG